jgi:hypothetical protein
MMKNPSQIQSQLAKAMDPRMLQQMGGMGNLMNMVKRKLLNSKNLEVWRRMEN